MNVTVADCLRLPTLREAQLVAGAKGLDRAVSSVSVLEWPETNLLSDELIVGNELVISALVTIKDDVARQCCVLRHLRSMGAAGLVLFYVGVFIPQIDDALIAVADEINLPLIAMPFGRMDFRYSDMITDIVEYIHKRRMQGNYYTAEVMNSIALLEPQQRNINTALRLLSDRMRCTLLLTDRYLERRGAAAWPVSTQWDYPALLQMLQKRKTLSKGQQTMELEGHSFKLWDIPVPSKTHRGMHLLVLDEFDQMDPERLQQAVDVVALFLNIWDKGTYYDGTDALVEAVLTDDPAKMRRLAQQMGISISAVNTMWVLQLSDLRTGQELTASQKLDVVLKLKVYLQEHHTSPLAMADHKNNRLTIELADPRDAHEAEVIGRNICVAFDMMAGLSGWMVNQAQIEAAIGNGTITRAKTVGEVMATYKTENPTENFYAYLAKHSSLKCQAVCRGKITKVETKTAGGFDYGTATVAGEDGSTYMVLFQNENLVIYKDGIVVMTAPDIISFYEINDGMPLTNADTKEGQYVDIGIIEVDERWWKNGEAAINDVWAPYFKNVEYTGRIVRYPAK